MPKPKFATQFKTFCDTSLRVGFFLAVRQIRRANRWSTFLIILVMLFTFLNMIVINGVLTGLPQGASDAYRSQYSGDIIITNLEEKRYINNTNEMIGALRNMPEVVSLTPRLLAGGFLEANYKTRLDGEEPEELAVQVAGIDPIIEDSVTHFSDLVIDGEYLTSDDRDAILVGRDILEYYAAGLPGESTLSNVHVGDTVRLQIGSIVREVTIKGVLKSKVNVVGQRVYMVDSHVRQILGRSDTNVNEIAVVLNDTYVPIDFKNSLRGYDFYYDAHVQTWDESQGKFFEDIVSTFSILGAIVGAIGALVASITIFIVIFINAISRQRYIGILKGIGVCGNAITVSYVLQSFFYSLIGNAIGIALLYAVLEPYLRANPIDFPFSDGILYVPVLDVLIRVLILFAVTLMAGYIPARMVVKRNTLDTILGR